MRKKRDVLCSRHSLSAQPLPRDASRISEEHRENGEGGLTLIEHLSFGSQPVFEGTVVLSATLLIEGVGPL